MLNQLQHSNSLALSITAIFAFVHNYNLQYITISPLSPPTTVFNPHCFTFLPNLSFFLSPNSPSFLQLSQRGGWEPCFCLMMLCWGERNLTVDILFLLFPIHVHAAEMGEAPGEDPALFLFQYLFSFHNKYPDQPCFISSNAPLFANSKYRFLSYCVHSVLTVTVQ